MIKVGIIGATGYAGAEIAGILLGHPEAEVVWYGSKSYVGEEFSGIYGNFFRIIDDKCLDDNMEELADEVDVVFTATPQGLCASLRVEFYSPHQQACRNGRLVKRNMFR